MVGRIVPGTKQGLAGAAGGVLAQPSLGQKEA